MFPTDAETDIWIALNRAQRSIYRSMDSALRSRCLPPQRWYDILWTLERTNRGLRPFELENLLLFEQSNFSRLARKMVDDGLVRECVFPGDRRGKLLSITEKGKRIRMQMWETYGPLIHEHMSKVAGRPGSAVVTAALRQLIAGDDRD